MQYWLMKSEPNEFSIDDLARVTVEPWDGVRNYQARNFMRDEMVVGDRAFFLSFKLQGAGHRRYHGNRQRRLSRPHRL